MAAAIDFLHRHGLMATRRGNRVFVTPRASVTEDVRRYVRAHRLELLSELAANDGAERRRYWQVSVPGYRPFRVTGEPMTHAEALESARRIWPTAGIIEEKTC